MRLPLQLATVRCTQWVGIKHNVWVPIVNLSIVRMVVTVIATALVTGECLCVSFICSVVIWDVAQKEALCGSQAAMQSAGPVYTLAFSRTRDDILVTGGE